MEGIIKADYLHAKILVNIIICILIVIRYFWQMILKTLEK